MADRKQASTHKPVTQLKLQQQNRACRLIALVPKSGARSDVDSSDNSADELEKYIPTTYSESSSPPTSLPSSSLDLNLLSDSNEKIDVITHNAPALQPYSSPASNACASPSILSPRQSTLTLLLQAAEISSPKPGPSHSKHTVPSSFTKSSPVPSPLASTSSYYAPSPAAATRSRKPNVVTKKKVLKPKRLEINWRCQKFTGTAHVEDSLEFSQEEKSPIEHFKCFFTDEIVKMIVEQTNLYSTQRKGVSINITERDVQDFIAINILLGIVKMPAYTDFWSQMFRYEKVANVLSLKKFQLLRRYLHFNDNLCDDGDRYYKIRPLLQKVQENCLKIEEERTFSIDETMVPYKGTRAGSRKQYVQNKPKKWGFKIFVRVGVSGIVYDFLVYGGEDTLRFTSFAEEKESMGLGAKVVIALAKSIRQPACKILCFDNFFTSIELMHRLRNEYGIFSLGTVRSNRFVELRRNFLRIKT